MKYITGQSIFYAKMHLLLYCLVLSGSIKHRAPTNLEHATANIEADKQLRLLLVGHFCNYILYILYFCYDFSVLGPLLSTSLS